LALKFSYPDYMQAAGVTITADSETGDMPGASVAKTQSDEFWRTVLSNLVTQAGMSVDLGQSRSPQFFGFQFDRQNNSAVIDEVDLAPARLRIKASNTTPDGGDVLDTGWITLNCLPGYGTYFHWLSSPITARYLRFDFDASNQVGELKLDVYRIYVGPQFSPEINMDWSPNLQWMDGGSAFTRGSRSTTRYINENEKYRSLSFNLSWIKEDTERAYWIDFERRVSTTREFAVSDTLEASGRADMFAFQSGLNGIASARTGISSKSIRLEENI